jgi:hypothetical protein
MDRASGLPAPEPGLSLADDVVVLRRLVERAQVAYVERLALLDSSSSGVVSGESTARFVAAEVGLPVRVISRELRWARGLHSDGERPCEATRQLLSAGELTTPQAEVIVRAMSRLVPQEVAAVEASVAQACAVAAPSAADQIVSRAVLMTGDAAGVAREARAEAARFLQVSPCGDMVRVDGMLAPVAGAGLMAALDALAQPSATDLLPGGPRRTRAQLMADALGELASRQLASGDLPTNGGVRPNVHVTVDLQDLLALSRPGFGVARVEGRSQGTVTAALANALGCDGLLDWSVTTGGRVLPGSVGGARPSGPVRPPGDLADSTDGLPVVDPLLVHRLISELAPALGGSAPVLLAAGRTSRLVTPAQRKALIHRDKGCVYPGCDRPADWCDAHHLAEWIRDGGKTDIDNLALVCRFHHSRLHEAAETLAHTPAGFQRIPAPPMTLPAPESSEGEIREGKTPTKGTEARTGEEPSKRPPRSMTKDCLTDGGRRAVTYRIGELACRR